MRQVRGMIHRYKTDISLPANEKAILLQKIEGKLNFIKLVRNEKDRAYRVLANEYRGVIGIPLYPLDTIDTIRKNIWILEVDGRDNGTAFSMGSELITCEHVIRNGTILKACRWLKDGKERYPVSVISQNGGLDIAKLKFIEASPVRDPLIKGISARVKEAQVLTVAGYPYYTDGRNISYYDTKVVAIRGAVFPLIIVDRTLVSGMSGGPALNSSNEVVGVLTRGATNLRVGENIDYYGIVPIDYVDQL